MRRFTNTIIAIFIIFSFLLPADCAIKGSLEYSIPVDYSKINEAETAARADSLYNRISVMSSAKLDDNITSALNLYTILSNNNPQNITYALRLGKLYDIIGKDRQAKGNYYRAMGINQSNPEPYFYLGEFFYKRSQFRRALKFYKKAYERGYSNHPQTITRLREIYKKFGDKNSLANLNH